MKLSIKLLAVACVIMAGGYIMSFAPFSNGGCTPGGGYYKATGASPVFTGAPMKIMGVGPDTLKMTLPCVPNCITFSTTLLQTGVVTPTVTTTTTGTLWVSSDGGNNYALLSTAAGTWSTVVTNTVTPVVEINPQSQANGSNPYTHYWWILAGHVSDTVTAVGTVTIR